MNFINSQSISSAENHSPMPLLTYDFLNYFVNDSLKSKTLLEIGSGDSTLFWQTYFGKVLTYEHDPNYYNSLKDKINNNITELNLFDIHVFNDSKFRNDVNLADYIIIDNDPNYVDRYHFCKFVVENKKHNSSIILDNGTWNLSAYKYLNQYFFCKDFPGINRDNEITVTSIFEVKRTPEYYDYTKIAWDTNGSKY